MAMGLTDRLSVSRSLEFEAGADELWDAISAPGNLNHSHPFCRANDVIRWERGHHSDQLVYLNGRTYVREFQTWDEGSGYTLLIGEEGGAQSYVVWEIESIGRREARLTITVYPYILAKLPNLLAYIPHVAWVKPRLERYLDAVISGFRYYLREGEAIPRNHFGRHPWFS